MDKESEIALSLRWRQTWRDKSDDYVCSAPQRRGSVGRIYLYGQAPAAGLWYWSYQGDVPGCVRDADCTGMEASPREAAKAVEDRWFAALEKAGKSLR
ncbi:hypothetical protein [Oricola sp.]|uniref:hypothetical protein n=1 Tax=Oricola sp. TaxID=1979950 RepID=UPI0035147856